jgi:hypothetical protein
MNTNLLTHKQALATACAGASLLYQQPTANSQQPTKMRVSIHQEEKKTSPETTASGDVYKPLTTACAGASLLYQQPTKLRVSTHQEEKIEHP